MANRNFKPGAVGIEKGLVCLFGRINIGAAGVISSQDCRGFSASFLGTGGYILTLEDKYTALYNVTGTIVGAVSATTASDFYVSQETVAADNKRLILQFLNGTGVNDDMADGNTLLIEVTLKNSTVKY
jgi:hypothetical protein